MGKEHPYPYIEFPALDQQRLLQVLLDDEGVVGGMAIRVLSDPVAFLLYLWS